MVCLTRLLWSVLVLALFAAPGRSLAAVQTRENDVKAAFLYNFTKFIEWPALPSDSGPFRICVIGDPAFARAVDHIIEGEAVQGHSMTRVEPHGPEDAHACRILYIGRKERAQGLRLAAALKSAPVLVIGDDDQIAVDGGAIGFVVEDNRVRFDINLAAIQRAGLIISSKLLRVARRVHGGEASQ